MKFDREEYLMWSGFILITLTILGCFGSCAGFLCWGFYRVIQYWTGP